MAHVRRTITLAAVAGALVGASLVLGPSAALAAPVPSVSSTPVVFTCAGTNVARPTSYTTTCADGYTYFSKLKWTSWGGASASGSGTFHMNPCTPNCVSSKEVAYPATIVLSKLKTVGSHRYYTALRATYKVSGKAHLYTFTLSTSR